MSTHTLSCAHCGSPCNEHAFNFRGDSNDPVSILDDIERLDQTILRLRLLKSQRHQQLNAIRSSTRIFPNEILISIFQYFCSFFEPQEFPQFILGTVCSHWRSLVYDAPRFWKNIDLTVQPRTVSSALSWLDVFKERNGASFNFIQLNFEKLFRDTSLCQGLLSSMNEMSTLSKIALHDPPVWFLQLISSNLSIRDVSLKRLFITTSLNAVPGLSLPWSALSVLQLSQVRINTCFDLLLECPNLIRFSNDDPLDSCKSFLYPNAHHTQQSCFPHLEYLRWHHGRLRWDETLLSFYRFPALQHFQWHGREYGYSLELFTNFTSSLSQSSPTFHISVPEGNDAVLNIDFILQVAYPIERLICSNFCMGSLHNALKKLQDRNFIPSMKFFKWEYQGNEHMTRARFHGLVQTFKTAIRVRGRTSAGRFRMEVEGVRLPEGYTKEATCELMGGGFEFEIAEDGCWIISF